MTDIGFVCEDDLDKIRVFTKSRQILELPSLSSDDCLFLSDWIEISSPVSYKKCDPVNLPHFKVWVEDGEVLVQLLVNGPNLLALPTEVVIKYEGLIWSPHLGLLRDDNYIYRTNFMGVGEVVVKYAPSGDTYFEVIRAVKWLNGQPEETDKSYMNMTPWCMETIADMALNEFHGDSCNTNRTQIFNQIGATGICIDHDFVNPCHSEIYRTPEKCCLLWSPISGLTGWMIVDQNDSNDFEAADPLLKLGEWYTYLIFDSRASSTKRDKQMLKREEAGKDPWTREKTMTFFHTTASRVSKVEKVKPTKQIVCEIQQRNGMMMMKNNIEIKCTFQFKHSSLETQENRSVENWEIRKKGLRTDAHFYDFDLGRIEIYPRISEFIIEKIETFEKDLKRSDSKEYERLQNETIIVRGTVSRFTKYFANSKKYPENGLFFLKTIHTICYYRGGKVIWQDPEEKSFMELADEFSSAQIKF
uniref:FBA_2 domain-containing protein n=1 Tax=Caenorhabditis tropicalis TaxID=1561998 RepID=A0A1I7V1R3_9PELO